MYEKLKHIEFFKNLSKETIDCINAIDMVIKEYEANELIYHFGDPIQYINVVLEGRVKTNEYMLDGKEIVSAYYFENEVFPFYLIYGGEKYYPYNVYSGKKTVICHIPVCDLVKCIDQDIHFLRNILVFVSEYTCYNKLIIRATQYNRVNKRLAYWLLHVQQENNQIHMPGSQEMLSDILRVNRSSLNQELRKLEKEDVITLKNKTITIIDRQYLEDLMQ